MFDPSDPPEPDPEEEQAHQERQAAAESPITVTGITVEAIRNVLDGAVEAYFYRRGGYGHDIEKKFNERLDEAIAKQIASVGQVAVQSLVFDEVKRAVDEGFQDHDPYSGRPTGKRVHVREMIEGLFTKKTSEGYQKPETTAVERVVRATVEAALAKDFAEIVKEAKAKFQAAVDSTVTAKLAETLKSALGLR